MSEEGNGTKYKIIKIEYCPSRCGQPCIVDVEKTYKENGEMKTKLVTCDVQVNHAYDNETGRFIPKTLVTTGELWDYKKFDFETPVLSVVGATNGIEAFIEKEFKRMFQEQRQKEGWQVNTTE